MPPVTHQVTLENGLKVILREVHTAPVVSTWIWYRVGSRNETEGHTGLSHWVEHMMFKGSSRFPKGSIMRSIDRHGGYVNAMTSYDFTAYYATLPSNWAELALEIESDRMLTATFDPEEVEAERTVIIAEREGSENEPRYVLAEEVAAAAFRVHPYHHQTIGWKADLQQIGRDQLYAHYRAHYLPNNAVLVVVGDLDAQKHLELIKRHFDNIAPAELPVSAIRPEPPQLGEKRVTVRMPGSAPNVRISYHVPPVSHPDYIPLVVLNAILSGGRAIFSFGSSLARSARLYRALVESQLASSVGSSLYVSLDPYLFTLGATVRDGRRPEEVEEALLAEVTKLQAEIVQTRELQVAVRQTEAQFAYSSESANGQALTLGFLEMVDRAERIDHVLQEFTQVTPDDVQRVARTYLVDNNRTVGWFLPTGDGGTSHGSSMTNYWTVPGLGYCGYRRTLPNDMISPETVVRTKLDNGIILLVKENFASSSVTVEGDFGAGALHETDEQAGLAALAASMVRRGTRQHSFQEINRLLDDVGASLHISASADNAGFSGRALAQDLDLLLELTAEVLAEPTFPEQELQSLRGQMLTQLGVLETNTGYRASKALMKALYPARHPYGRPLLGTRETVSALTLDEIVAFHRTKYHPATLALSVVGAVPAPQVVEKVKATLAHWRVDTEAPEWHVPQAETPPEVAVQWVELPEKAQADLIWGVIGMERASEDYYPALVADLVLGRLGLMGRLGQNVRDEQGLAYYISSSLESSWGPHPWIIRAGINARDVDRTIESILAELARLRDEPISSEELADSQSYLTGMLPLRLETNAGIADFLLAIEEYSLGLDYLQRYPDMIAGVTKDAVQRVAQKYLTLDRYVLAVAGTF